MATAPGGSWITYSAVGIREDLSDVIYDISPTETPFISNLAREGGSNTLHEWQMDNLAAAAANAEVEGGDFSGQAQTPTLRLANYMQIFRKDIVVTGTMRAMDTAGRADELDYLTVKAGRELKRDMEFTYTRNTEASAGGATTARNLAGAEAWLGSAALASPALTYAYATATGATTDTTPGVATATGLVTTGPTDGTQAAFVKASLDTVIRQAWINGGEPRVVMVGPFNKGVVSGFTGIATLQKDVPGNTQGVIVAAADIYVSDFGVHTIVPNRFSRDRTALVLDMTMWANAELRPMATVPIAKTGDSDKVMLITESTLVCRNPFASGKAPDLTTA